MIRLNRLVRCVLALCLMAWSGVPAQAAVPHTVRVCGDINEFAPFIYFERAGGKKTATVAGLDLDVLHAILGESGHDVKIDMLPWARCLILGARGDYDILLDGIKSPARERDFILSSVVYSLTPVILYLKGKPVPPTGNKAELATQRICSQADYNYENYGVANALITNRARSIDDAATMLKLGRCTLMLQQVETLQAHAALGGKDFLASEEYETIYPEWLKKIDFYFLTSRANRHSKELVGVLDRGIARMKKNGDIDRLRNKHQFRQ